MKNIEEFYNEQRNTPVDFDNINEANSPIHSPSQMIEFARDYHARQVKLGLLDVSLPKGTFTCTICGDDMEEGEQCGYENVSCPNYTGK